MPRRSRYNGDGHLRLDHRAAYLIANYLQNQQPYRAVDSQITISDFRLDDAAGSLQDVPGTPSPSRALSDLFWMHLPWADMQRELGSLNMLDLGCGTGSYALNFQRWGGGCLAKYTGLDQVAHPRWVELARADPSIDFVVGDMERLGRQIPEDTTLIVSQSALEHVRDDERCFEELRRFAERVKRPLAMIHLVPSAACLPLYLWHGYRQYTPRTLSALTHMFADAERSIVRLGGAACNRLHWRFITWPLMIRGTGDLRDQQPAEYRRALEEAIVEDMRAPQPSPAFYAVMIRVTPA